MDQRITQTLFALFRSAICGTKLTEQERSNYSPEQLRQMFKISSQHDVAHLLVYGLQQNELIAQEGTGTEKFIFNAVYRYSQTKYEYEKLCEAFEKAEVPFLPLKGSVIRQYYAEPWMRTSCDIDILVRREDLEKAVSYLVDNHKYVEKERATHDVSLYSPSGVHLELHFDLVEEGRAKSAFDILKCVWENATLRKNSEFWYEMSDAYLYFYHIAHMAKHFETGGCGIRPFIDLWILDNIGENYQSSRDELLSKGELLKFANVCRDLNQMWFGGKEADNLSLQMQDFILSGGLYGSVNNRVALQQKKNGGRFGYLLSRLIIPYAKLKRYYPILEKHRWLTPVMQVRRWFTLLRPDVAKMAREELAANGNLDKAKSEEMNVFLDGIGLS